MNSLMSDKQTYNTAHHSDSLNFKMMGNGITLTGTNCSLPLDLGWRDRTRKETELMNDLIPLLKRMVSGPKISGLSAYEE